MREVTLRDANQQFSKLVREIEETGESVAVLRNGKPAVIMSAVQSAAQGLTREQQLAKARLMDPAKDFSLPGGWKFNREEIYEDAILRHGVARSATLREQKTRRRG